MIKLIASDMDGTMLPEGTDLLNPEYYDVIRALKAKGITFAASSGRPYSSMVRVLEPVKNDILFITDNGATVVEKEEIIAIRTIEPKIFRELNQYFRSFQQYGAFWNNTTADKTYVETRDPDFLSLMIDGYHVDLGILDDLFEIRDPIIKMAIFFRKDMDLYRDRLIGDWKDRLNAVAAGERWVDFMSKGTDKGSTLKSLCQARGISPEEVITFGDQENDVGMFLFSKDSCAVSDGSEIARSKAARVIGSYREDAVLKELKKLL